MPNNKELEKYLATKGLSTNKTTIEPSVNPEVEKYLDIKSRSNLTPEFESIQGEYQLDSQYDPALRSGMNQEKLRGEMQPVSHEIANTIAGGIAKIPFTVIGNVASILDFEDYVNTDNEVGNSVTAAMEEIKGNIEDATKIYKSNDNTLSSREWWMNNAKGLFDSAGAFALTGMGLGKGVQLLSQLTKGSKIVQAAGTTANAIMLNQAESVPIAMSVYKTSYDIELGK